MTEQFDVIIIGKGPGGRIKIACVAALLGALGFAGPSFAQPMLQPIPYQSKLGKVDCGTLCGDPKAAPKACQKDEDCNSSSAIIGGLPYGCLTDVQLCGWKALSGIPSSQNPQGQ